MSAVLSLLSLLVFIAAGMLSALLPAVRKSSLIGKISAVLLYLLLFFMGFRISSVTDPAQIVNIGVMSVVFAIAAAAGTAAVLYFYYAVRFRFTKAAVPAGGQDESCRNSPSERQSGGFRLSSLKDPLRLLAAVIVGFISGSLIHIPGFTGEDVSTWMLRFLLFTIGIDLVKNGVSLKESLSGFQALILPVLVVAGTIAGSLLPAVLFSVPVRNAAAVVSGFGWYSLSGVLITDMGDPYLGSVAFLSNILRETIALITIPFIGRTRFKDVAIGIAGATSMDVTLPLIEKCCGPAKVPLSVASGAILSLLVPVIVPILFQA